jgi:hypothetical protein
MRSPLRFLPTGAGTWLLVTAACTVQPATRNPPHRADSVITIDSDPHNMSVLYSNQSSDHLTNGEPRTAVITWLSPGTVHPGWEIPGQGCPPPGGRGCSAFYRPGFRRDIVQPYQRACVHFVAPSGQVAVEFAADLAGGGGMSAPPAWRPNGGIAWSSDSSWGFDGSEVKPAGTVDSSFDRVDKVWVHKVVKGC